MAVSPATDDVGWQEQEVVGVHRKGEERGTRVCGGDVGEASSPRWPVVFILPRALFTKTHTLHLLGSVHPRRRKHLLQLAPQRKLPHARRQRALTPGTLHRSGELACAVRHRVIQLFERHRVVL